MLYKEECYTCIESEDCSNKIIFLALVSGKPLKDVIDKTCQLLSHKPPAECQLCGEKAELRPAGPNGKHICYECAMKDENKKWLDIWEKEYWDGLTFNRV
jgi:hypothetical protein